MHLVYIDDSQDQESRTSVFAALMIPAKSWRASFNAIKGYRMYLKEYDGIPLYKEFHAWKFVSGRGHLGRVVFKSRRCAIFKEALSLIATLPDAKLINTCMPSCYEDRAFERLLNRINTNVKKSGSNAFLICDEGKEDRYTKLVRKMSVHNYIGSRYGAWGGGVSAKNIPISEIVEDPVFKQSEKSYMIQMADFCAYALLRNEHPTEYSKRFGLDGAYELLKPLFVPEAYAKDPRKMGIIREK